jgi:hypothetical protein
MIVGFDPSITHYGWVLLDETKILQPNFPHKGSGTVSEGVLLVDSGTFKTDPSTGLLVQRLILQRERVKKLLIDNSIRFVTMEAPLWHAMSTELLFALNQFIHEVFLNLNIFVLYVQPYGLKKAACPNMNPRDVTKNHVTDAAKSELGLHGRRFSEHLADAYFVGKIGCVFYNWYFTKKIHDNDLSPYLRDLFMGKHVYTKGKKKGITEYTGIIYKENEQFFDYSKQQIKTESIIQGVLNATT